jgi:hypothetical protein
MKELAPAKISFSDQNSAEEAPVEVSSLGLQHMAFEMQIPMGFVPAPGLLQELCAALQPPPPNTSAQGAILA